jgi:hypothetical protein
VVPGHPEQHARHQGGEQDGAEHGQHQPLEERPGTRLPLAAATWQEQHSRAGRRRHDGRQQ